MNSSFSSELHHMYLAMFVLVLLRCVRALQLCTIFRLIRKSPISMRRNHGEVGGRDGQVLVLVGLAPLIGGRGPVLHVPLPGPPGGGTQI